MLPPRPRQLAALLTTTIALSAITTQLSAAELVPFAANYSSNYGMLSANGVRKLEKRSDGSWAFDTRASALMNEVVESSTFSLSSGRVKSLSYDFRNPFNSKRNMALKFDWTKGEATDSAQNKTVPLSGEIYDKLSYQLQMQQDVCGNPEKFGGKDYVVVDRGKLKTYRVEFVNRQPLQTKVGSLATIHLRQYRPDKRDDDDTLIWLASDFNCVLARLDQHDGDNLIRLDLTDATVNGKIVKGK